VSSEFDLVTVKFTVKLLLYIGLTGSFFSLILNVWGLTRSFADVWEYLEGKGCYINRLQTVMYSTEKEQTS
jgi:hypothetical protein